MTRRLQEIGIQTARQLLDFSGDGQDQGNIWEEQLEGAVAIHNILVREKVAYLADEVGMGKTFVALGAISLFRHFNPGWRVLYITPRQNIQEKWFKEIHNFTRNNWKVVDNRVRSFQSTPAYRIARCDSLFDLVRQVNSNPNRDFLMRMTSFSLPLPTLSDDNVDRWVQKRKEIIEQIPWLEGHFPVPRQQAEKADFKDNYAGAVNTILPHFDMLVIDEGHNLKHGRQGAAARNRLMAQVLGHPGLANPRFSNYGRRFDRVLILSATPLESDYRELWNQLDLFDHGQEWEILNAADAADVTEQDKQAEAHRFLVRRLGGLTIGQQRYTKNRYRREWRNGGLSIHDKQLPIPDERQRLIVALVQKKVSEILGHKRFNNRFQIGMLASFESFLETANHKKANTDDNPIFDGVEQTDEQLEKEGIDTLAIDTLAQSYRETFGEPMPHPKMDAVVKSLTKSFVTGEKVLIFVRRVKSVSELREKLNHLYDRWLKAYMLNNLNGSPQVQQQVEEVFQRYEADRKHPIDQEEDFASTSGEEDEQSSTENFFTWFFRGTGPSHVFSGATFNGNRLSHESSPYSVFFEDNYITHLLGASDDPAQAIADQVGGSIEKVVKCLRQTAAAIFRPGPKQKGFPRRRIFFAYQEAALCLLENAKDLRIKEKARIIRRERFGGSPIEPRLEPGNFPAPVESLQTKTFFTELVKRPGLREKIWPSEENSGDDFKRQFRRQEQRRELLSAAARLGRPFIDLWLLVAQGFGSLVRAEGERTDYQPDQLIGDYFDLLERQQQEAAQYHALHELTAIAENFDLIMAVNSPQVRDGELSEVSRMFGQLLGRQTPVGGMSGGVNQSLVRQFRMPGYPLFLITTDVLQEGEDLHTFCSKVIHYGISWTPSAMEQRTGRVDRIQSLTQRRLDNRPEAKQEDKLQVYYPHLKETVERLQVERVYERMNRFIRLMHRSFTGERLRDSHIDTAQGFIVPPRDIKQIDEPLETVFPIKREEWLLPDQPAAAIKAISETQKVLDHFNQMTASLETVFPIKVEKQPEPWSFYATVFVDPDGRLVGAGGQTVGKRHQPFALFLRTATGDGKVLLRCVSPIGLVRRDDADAIERVCQAQQQLGFGKICAVSDVKLDTYNLTVEADILFHPDTTQKPEVADLVTRTACCADHMEKALLSDDRPMRVFREELAKEPRRG